MKFLPAKPPAITPCPTDLNEWHNDFGKQIAALVQIRPDDSQDLFPLAEPDVVRFLTTNDPIPTSVQVPHDKFDVLALLQSVEINEWPVGTDRATEGRRVAVYHIFPDYRKD